MTPYCIIRSFATIFDLQYSFYCRIIDSDLTHGRYLNCSLDYVCDQELLFFFFFTNLSLYLPLTRLFMLELCSLSSQQPTCFDTMLVKIGSVTCNDTCGYFMCFPSYYTNKYIYEIKRHVS